MTQHDLLLTNAKIVTPEESFLGTIQVLAGHIVHIDRGQTMLPTALDVEGDYITPGVVELHTDNMEKHFSPRPGVGWHPRSAVVAHDTQIIGAGITTVFDALAIGDLNYDGTRIKNLNSMAETIEIARSEDLFRAEHFLHMRCELSYEGVLELFQPFADNELVKMVSFMDHAPGQRQFTDVSKYRQYFQEKYNISKDGIEDFIKRHTENSQRYSDGHRQGIAEICRDKNFAMASHDDATIDHVAEASEYGMVISEFPTTKTAAHSAREKGMKVLMGAPNVVRGESHSGNVSALDLAELGRVDILSSDYFPASILHGAFVMHREVQDITISQAINTVTANPARAANLNDRGEISPGKRADLVRVKLIDDMPLVRQVWREGDRVY